jgi:hypothetical protein
LYFIFGGLNSLISSPKGADRPKNVLVLVLDPNGAFFPTFGAALH